MIDDFKVITFDLYCKWKDSPPMYRLYVDGELLTERNYRWDNKDLYVHEIITVDIAPGEHEFKLDAASLTDILRFSVKNFAIDDKPTALVNGRFVVS